MDPEGGEGLTSSEDSVVRSWPGISYLPLASMRFTMLRVVPVRYQLPMKKPWGRCRDEKQERKLMWMEGLTFMRRLGLSIGMTCWGFSSPFARRESTCPSG